MMTDRPDTTQATERVATERATFRRPYDEPTDHVDSDLEALTDEALDEKIAAIQAEHPGGRVIRRGPGTVAKSTADYLAARGWS